MNSIPNENIKLDTYHFREALLDRLPVASENNSGINVGELINKLHDHFDDHQSVQAKKRKVQRALKVLIQEEKAARKSKGKNDHEYFRVQEDQEESIDPHYWGYLMKSFRQNLADVLPAKRLTAAMEKLQDRDQGISLNENIFQVAPDVLSLLPADFDPVHLSLILRALVESKKIEVTYLHSNGDRKTFALHPQGAVQSGPRLFLFASRNNENHVDTFALHRFIKITMTDEPARKANNFNLHKAIEGRDPNANDTQKIKLVLLTRGFVTNLLHDCRLSEDQVIVDEDRYPGFNACVTATVMDSLNLERWLIGRGTNLCVLEPRQLAERLAHKAAKIAWQHTNLPLAIDDET